MTSNTFQQDVEIERVPVAQQAEEIPFRDQLGGRVQPHHDFIGDGMDAHPGPFLAFLVLGISYAPQQRDHTQLLQQNTRLLRSARNLSIDPNVEH